MYQKICPPNVPTKKGMYPPKKENSSQVGILWWLRQVYWEFDRHFHNLMMTNIMSLVKNSKVIHVWVSSVCKCPHKHHPGKAAGGIKWLLIFFPWDSGARSEKQWLGGWWAHEDLELFLSALGEKVPCFRYFRKSIESRWPESSVVESPTRIVAIATTIAHWGVGADVATANTIPQGVAVAAPVASWEDSAGEVVIAHGVWSWGPR